MMVLLPGAISELTDNLILCSASSVNSNVLDALNVACVVNVAPELPDTPLHRSDIVYHKIPILDSGNSRIYPWFDETADLIQKVSFWRFFVTSSAQKLNKISKVLVAYFCVSF